MRIEVGTNVRWTSKAGVLTGRVKSIRLDLNAANETIPWLTVQDIVGERGRQYGGIQMPATEGYFKMMKLEVLR